KQAEERIDNELKRIKSREEALEKKYESREDEFDAQLAKERKQIEEKVKKEAAQAQQTEFADLKEQLGEKIELLQKAEEQELQLRKKQRALEEKARSMEIEMARRLDQERKSIIDKISNELEESHRLKDAEKEKQLSDMRKQIEDLKRKSEQGSQKIQGQVLELELEDALKKEFQFDIIEPIAPGIKGGDIIQIVKTQSGRECGKILWETKRTKNWNDQWIQKLKNDKRDVKADIAVLVSEALPDGFKQFREISGVWVTDIPSAISLSLALRVVLNQVAVERALQTGKKEKAELVYNYLTGIEFKSRVEAIIEAFKSIKDDLDTEKRSMERVWSKREKQIQHVLLNIAGMHGDLAGLAGASLPGIKMLELPSDAAQDAAQ
ncbi:MAG: DUF2130 domain-containing protein, partial [Candidatus Omnitrophota bacterium]|nr:DUF2130 domain-containing protein [Candidatus Omnitrophota bacterium]